MKKQEQIEAGPQWNTDVPAVLCEADKAHREVNSMKVRLHHLPYNERWRAIPQGPLIFIKPWW